MKCGSRIQGRVLDYTSDGRGVLREEDAVVFVEGGVIGDLLLVEITGVKKNYFEARLTEVLQPSPERVVSDCPAFGICGGCDLRTTTYFAQLGWKKQFTENALKKIGGFPHISAEDVIGAEQRDGYRNNIQLPIRKVGGEIQIGFFAKKSQEVISCAHCRVIPADSLSMISELKEIFGKFDLPVFDGQDGIFKHLGVRFSVIGELTLILVTRKRWFHENRSDIRRIFSDKFLHRHHIVSVFENINPKEEQTFGREWHLLYGKPEVEEFLCGKKFHLSPASFFQVHRAQAEKLYGRVMEYADVHSDDILLDLYCGVGSIGLCMAEHVKALIGIEIVSEAIENAKKNALLNKISNATFYAGKAEKILSSTLKNLKPDVVILDPPRKGADQEVLKAIGSMNPKKIVYVSCNPTTLARDLKILHTYGYELTKATVTDMFPMTVHCEVVAFLTKM